ncbi:MAG: GlsB/YeaQ/YmgE family stress response membrane protein [Pegethrix bostrychoides GSE-TBD4-15B]|uniref:GlsB/YeaQ/YmgE family stress response membrane protein n=1 Tax=Pegethrix bostrychoides GSE-TBD4-15B TaxID=2839662 RepID=A0A951P8Z7_9CYAN|nr:GlsB/YeaQ/YmgE family stress response membrane protein [Pegethrix bostrychoides GSE-TBD4-15B]
MNILAWLILGLIAGAIAKAIYPGHQSGGILGTLVLGVIGAFVGGSLYNLLTTGTIALTSAGAGLSIGGIVVAVLGAIVALFIYYALSRRSAI